MCYTYRTLPSPSEGEEHLTDAELITRSHEGDEDALVALLAKYELLVRKVIRQEIHEAPDAAHLCDDIYQDTVAKKSNLRAPDLQNRLELGTTTRSTLRKLSRTPRRACNENLPRRMRCTFQETGNRPC